MRPSSTFRYLVNLPAATRPVMTPIRGSSWRPGLTEWASLPQVKINMPNGPW